MASRLAGVLGARAASSAQIRVRATESKRAPARLGAGAEPAVDIDDELDAADAVEDADVVARPERRSRHSPALPGGRIDVRGQRVAGTLIAAVAGATARWSRVPWVAVRLKTAAAACRPRVSMVCPRSAARQARENDIAPSPTHSGSPVPSAQAGPRFRVLYILSGGMLWNSPARFQTESALRSTLDIDDHIDAAWRVDIVILHPRLNALSEVRRDAVSRAVHIDASGTRAGRGKRIRTCERRCR